MELIPLLSTIILGVTIATIVFALFSYMAYRARERKAPKSRAQSAGASPLVEPRFFKRYFLKKD
jgi:heme/copper-type cytochrome/quinol oxidase subunit 2